jgi:phospholipase/carboxylesterase
MSRETYIHRRREGRPGAPTLFVFHGTGGDENQFFGFAADVLPEATVVAPRGDVSEGGALRYFRRRAEGLYDMEDLALRADAMAKFVAAHRGDGPVLGMGYSNGANILAAMMLKDGGLFDGAVLLHPLIPWTPADNAALAGRRVLITAGRADPICPAPQTEALKRYLDKQGAEVTMEWHPGGHDIRSNEVEAATRFLQGFRPVENG